jgi:1,4-dihydroxy-6-naphthoate synthase
LFCALAHGEIPGAPPLAITIADVDQLNDAVCASALDVSKVSYGAVPELGDHYVVLRSGGALGRGCGPLLVARQAGLRLESLRGRPIAIPGTRTTAHLLLRLRDPLLGPFQVMRFDRIAPAVAAGTVAAGLIIHESRFTYAALGLSPLLDLGAWWQEFSGLPIPLGAVVARRALGGALIARLGETVRSSVARAFARPERTRAFVRAHARELDDRVIDAHIALYTGPFSLDVGEQGMAAVRTLLSRAAAVGLAPSPARDPFDFD